MDGRSLDSPCNNVCTLDAATRTCIGCGRTLDEIEHWIEFTAERRTEIIAGLPARRAGMAAQRVSEAAGRAAAWPATQCSRCGASFACGASDCSTPCWCASYPPVDPVEGAGCLCPACLAATRADATA
ncbi:MAG TPA: DUF1289 domain-containing protein [Usitatibacter sp.]|nr:DUF1289 domain-containing protein [Usitatibacter sp.]